MYCNSKLNDIQKKIVKDTEGAILVTAGAGSGKTRLLTHRICYIISEKLAYPENVLAITFTNKATNEMKERINSMLPNGKGVWISTFHAMCVRILRENIYKLDNYTKYFTIYNDNDKSRIIKNIIKQLDISNNEFTSKLTWHISNAKNKGEALNEFSEELQYEPYKNEILRASAMYEEALKNNNALDFDDLLLKTVELFKHNPQTLEYYQEKFKYIHVDEFQDTNTVQYQIVKLLTGKHKNIFVVGDEDQCIYCWRGANIENIKKFVMEFECKVYKLEQNYRSTKTIISTANKLIKYNKERIDKTLFTENEEGEKITYYKAYDEVDEAEYVSKSIIKLIDNGVPLHEIGVLMRISSLSRLIEEKLLNYDIPFKVSGIFKFFERLEIKNVLAYLSVLVNNRDNASLLRIINIPRRGVGQATVEKLLDYAQSHQISLFEAVLNIEGSDLPNGIKSKVQGLSNILNHLMQQKDSMPFSDFLQELLNKTGISNMYNTNSDEDEDRRRNLEQLMQSAKSFQHLSGGGIVEYLESVTLQSSTDEEEEDESAVSISTVHASKGLEFDYVFIIGLEENCFPLARKMEIEDIEEERRLAYVALTRARKKVYLTRASSRFLYGNRNQTIASRFIKESGIVEQSQFTSNNKYSYSNASNNTRRERTSIVNNYTMKDFKEKTIKNNDKQFEEFVVDANVSHPTFGEGKIIARENVGDITFVTVEFTKIGVKKLALSFAPLKVI